MKYDVVIRIERNGNNSSVRFSSDKKLCEKEYADIIENLLNCFEKNVLFDILKEMKIDE